MLRPKVVVLDERCRRSTSRFAGAEPSRRLAAEFQLAYVFVSHDLSVVKPSPTA
jgi:ABC-type microcin C transport system duplicated ATPase subunit YejF